MNTLFINYRDIIVNPNYYGQDNKYYPILINVSALSQFLLPKS